MSAFGRTLLAGKAIITGDVALAKKLDKLAKQTSIKAAKAGTRAELKVLTKAIKAGVNASSASANLKREARAAVGSSFGKRKGGPTRGKVEARAGFAVGKTQKQIGRQAKKRDSRIRGVGGVGISASNVHWFVLGTEGRGVGADAKKNRKAGGKYSHGKRGDIAPVFKDVTKQAVSACKTEMLSAARAAIRNAIQREVSKPVS